MRRLAVVPRRGSAGYGSSGGRLSAPDRPTRGRATPRLRGGRRLVSFARSHLVFRSCSSSVNGCGFGRCEQRVAPLDRGGECPMPRRGVARSQTEQREVAAESLRHLGGPAQLEPCDRQLDREPSSADTASGWRRRRVLPARSRAWTRAMQTDRPRCPCQCCRMAAGRDAGRARRAGATAARELSAVHAGRSLWSPEDLDVPRAFAACEPGSALLGRPLAA